MPYIASKRALLTASPAAIVPYLLRATFNAADQGFSDGQVLDSEAEGVQDGQLTVVEVDGTVAISSNKSVFTAQTTAAWGDLGFYSGAITRAIGTALLCTILRTADQDFMVLFQDLASVDTADNEHGFYFRKDGSDGILYPRINGASGFSTHAQILYDLNTTYEIALLLGGYDASNVPYRAGETKADYANGAWLLIKGGDYTTWTLIWFNSAGTNATLYAAVSNHSAGFTVDDFRVPDVDLSAIHETIAAYSTFTAANGTSLDAITPEAGEAWTEDGNAAWDIQSNKAESDHAAPSIATVDAGLADVLVDCTITTDTGTNNNSGLVVRATDIDNCWHIQLQDTGAAQYLRFVEYNSGSATERVSNAGIGFSDGNTMLLRVATDGQSILAWSGKDWAGFTHTTEYASATFNLTETKHGLCSLAASATLNEDTKWDNFAIYPRTHATFDAQLDAV